MGKKYKILYKILSVIGDNASNNNTLCRHLYRKLSKEYDSFIEEEPIRGKRMRFDGEESQVRCYTHVLNLVCNKALDSLGLSNVKNTKKFLARAQKAN